MIDGNICTEIGDVLYITTQVPIIATTSLLTFSDTIIGTTGTRFFNKLFQYSPDGIVFGEWEELFDLNLQKIEFQNWNTPIINLRYERAGSDASGDLQFINITFGGTAINYLPNYPIGSLSLFKDIIYNNPEVFQLTINFAQKLYKSGIVPQYIERGDTDINPSIDDNDYIAYIKTIGHFFALFSVFSQKFKNLYFIREWLIEYVKEYGLFLNGDEEMADIQYIIANLYDEYRKRGTSLVVIPKGIFLLDGSETIVDGEYLRLIGWKTYEDFLFQLRKKQFIGYWINCNSSNYKGLTHTGVQINKAPENTQDVLDLDRYIVTGSPVLITDGSKNVVQLNPSDRISFKTPISVNLDYELTFWCKIDIASVAALQVLGIPFNHYGMTVNGGQLKDTAGTNNNLFLNSLVVADAAQYYFVRIILYKSSTVQTNTTTNMNQGVNLCSVIGQEEIQWFIGNAHSTALINLWDIKCRPLRSNYSTGFVQAGNVIEIWRKNNNANYNNDQSNYNAQKLLFPYNSKQFITDI